MEVNSYYNRQDKNLANFIVGYYFVQALNLLVKLVIGDFALWTPLSRGSLIILLLFSFKPMINRNGRAFFWTEILFAVLFGYTFLFHHASFSNYRSIVMNVFTVFIPMAIAAASIYDKSILLKRMYFMAWPTQLILIYILLTRSSFSYSMIGGYTLLFQALIVFDHLLKTHKWYDLLACMVDLTVIFIFGSRGPILCVLAIIVIKILFNPSISKGKRITFMLLTFVAIGATFFFYNDIINGLILITNKLGYSSRNLYLLLNGRITSESGRDSIQRAYLESIKNGPVLGSGIAGGWISVDTYPHNIVIELLVSFGPVLGILTCIAVAYITIYAINNKDEDKRRLAHILFAYSISLLLSDTFLKSPMFFMLMAIGLQAVPFRIAHGKKTATGRI
jgi:hypothetical protein